MTNLELIAQHLNELNLKLPIHKVDTVCSFTGEKIVAGVSNDDLIQHTFTDHAYIKYPSGYSSIHAALCMSAVIKSEKGFNSLRNYSYLATNQELKLLKRSDILSILVEPPSTEFVLCVTYSNKKHTAYKSRVNYSDDDYVVTTDKGNVEVNLYNLKYILPILQSWYTVTKDTKQQPTYFTKKDILNGCSDTRRIHAYGVEKYFEESAQIESFRNTAFLELVVFALNKNQ